MKLNQNEVTLTITPIYQIPIYMDFYCAYCGKFICNEFKDKIEEYYYSDIGDYLCYECYNNYCSFKRQYLE